MFTCDLCSAVIAKRKHLYEHKRNVHNVEPELSGSVKCPVCDNKVRRQKDLILHMRTSHSIDCEKEQLIFKSLADFLSWKQDMEKETKSSYVKHKGTQMLQDGQSKSTYLCHRQGEYKDKVGDARKRRLKCIGSNKMGSACPSFMEVYSNGQDIQVTFWKTHCGHISSVERLFLTKDERAWIAGLIDTGMNIQVILDSIRGSAQDDNFQRLHFITRKDIHNIRMGLALQKEEQQLDDEVGVEITVEASTSDEHDIHTQNQVKMELLMNCITTKLSDTRAEIVGKYLDEIINLYQMERTENPLATCVELPDNEIQEHQVLSKRLKFSAEEEFSIDDPAVEESVASVTVSTPTQHTRNIPVMFKKGTKLQNTITAGLETYRTLHFHSGFDHNYAKICHGDLAT